MKRCKPFKHCKYSAFFNCKIDGLNKKLTSATLLINSAPSQGKWLERAQNYFNKKAILVYAVFTWNSCNIFGKEL